MNTLVETTAGEKLAVWTKRYTVHGLGVFRQRVYTYTPLHVPEPNGRIEGRTG